jgi:hypothetical protein
MATFTFTGTATADSVEQAEALAKQQAQEEALLSQGAFVQQTSFNEVKITFNDDGTYTATFTLKVTDDVPVDSAGDIVQSQNAVNNETTTTTPTNAEGATTQSTTSNTPPPKLTSSNTNGAVVNTSSIPGAVAVSNNALDPGNQNQPETSYIYRAIEVLSIFSRGQFIQEIQGAQIFFDVPETPTQSDTSRQESAQVDTAAEARKKFAATDPRRVDINRPVTENLREPSPGEENQDPAGTGDAAAIINAAANRPATSNGQVIGTTPANTTGGTAQRSTPVTLTLRNGTTTTVTSPEQVNALLANGQIDFRTASGATIALQSLTSSQNTTSSVLGQQLMSLER